MASVRVLTIQQPWAELAVLGIKEFETRTWDTKFRGELHIHASLTMDAVGLDIFYNEPYTHIRPMLKGMKLGAIIGKVNLINTMPAMEAVKVISKQEKSLGFYTKDRFAWAFANPVMFDKPIYCKGNLGIWRCELSDKEMEVLNG